MRQHRKTLKNIMLSEISQKGQIEYDSTQGGTYLCSQVQRRKAEWCCQRLGAGRMGSSGLMCTEFSAG